MTDIDQSYRVTAAELRQFIERAERCEAEKRDIAEQLKEVFAEAKGRGYDVKVMKKVIALRRRDPDDVAEEEAVLDMYRDALGLALGDRLSTYDPDEDEDDDEAASLI